MQVGVGGLRNRRAQAIDALRAGSLTGATAGEDGLPVAAQDSECEQTARAHAAPEVLQV
ncbi:MAG TPA: hypothetical protein VGP46_09475 [Acidimicrobiales bacterium]|nr:hypothetical protein [Acidimicrobiales bacterium]